jgi:hypothetical protein
LKALRTIAFSLFAVNEVKVDRVESQKRTIAEAVETLLDVGWTKDEISVVRQFDVGLIE